MITINEYIRSYQYSEDPGTITVSDIYNKVKANFWKYLGTGLLVMIIVLLGLVALVIPGYYLGVALTFALPVITHEGLSGRKAIDRSFKIISSNWWATLGFFIVLSILVGFVAYIVIIPLSMVSAFFLIKSEFSSIYSFIYALINSLNLVLYFLIYVIIFIGINIKYFSLVEKKEQVGLKEEIEKMDVIKDESE